MLSTLKASTGSPNDYCRFKINVLSSAGVEIVAPFFGFEKKLKARG